MATVARENIGLLNDKLTVTIQKEDYLNNFEQSLKKYAKNANISGFRKGMVPAGLVKKMYGQGVFTEEVVKLAEKQLFDYLETEKLDIFAQPLPVDFDTNKLDVNNPTDYNFSFEIGLKPEISIDPSKLKVTRYVINVDEKLIDEEVERLRTRHGKMTELETIAGEENVLNVNFVETDAEGNVVEGGITKANSLLVKYFSENYRTSLIGKNLNDTINFQLNKVFDEKELEFIAQDLGLNKDEAASLEKYFNLTISKIGHVEKAEMNDEFFAAAFPNKEIKSEEDCRKAIQEDIAAAYAAQSKNQLHDQLYHQLIDNTTIEFPANFLKRWLQNGGEQRKTAEEAEAEYPSFENSLKWTLISTKVAADNKVEVMPDDIRAFAKNQLFSYMGAGVLDESQPWVEDYVNRMMKDKKFVEDSYYRIQTEKMFESLEAQVKISEESITAEAFAEKMHHHHH
ncbi:MAG: trigger factor [Chitinophagaceae bacterium]|nr:trigger factor [Chitinophagaceae bacterium]